MPEKSLHVSINIGSKVETYTGFYLITRDLMQSPLDAMGDSLDFSGLWTRPYCTAGAADSRITILLERAGGGLYKLNCMSSLTWESKEKQRACIEGLHLVLKIRQHKGNERSKITEAGIF